MYKINLHAHTIFSDGINTPLGMALKAKELGFSALVITDHYYGPHPERTNWTMDIRKMRLLKRARDEAKKVLPTIIGIELSFGNEEILTFGSAMIQRIMQHRDAGREITMEHLQKWKKSFNGAFILCHPQEEKNWSPLMPILDGYEQYNSGQDMFPGRSLDCLSVLPGWCNSDAHVAHALPMGYNLVDSKIETEDDLIKYIRKGKQPRYALGAGNG